MDPLADRTPTPQGDRVGWYVALRAATAGLGTAGFLIIAAAGHDIARPDLVVGVLAHAPTAASPPTRALARLVIALSIIVVAARLLGGGARRLAWRPRMVRRADL